MGPPASLFGLFRAGAVVCMAHIVTPEAEFCLVFQTPKLRGNSGNHAPVDELR